MNSSTLNINACEIFVILFLDLDCVKTSEIDRISANFFRAVYRRWNYRPIELHCPFKNPVNLPFFYLNSLVKFGTRLSLSIKPHLDALMAQISVSSSLFSRTLKT